MRSFREYVDWEVARKKRFLHPYLVDRKGELLVDYLGRYERIATDHEKICRLIGIEPGRLPHLGRATSMGYREYYDGATKRKVAQCWARDLDFFGYDFDGQVGDRYALR